MKSAIQKTSTSRCLAAAVLFASLGSAVALAQSSSAPANAGGTSTASSTALKRADQRLLNKIAELNRDEIALSQLAAERASSDQVRSFAQMLLKDHSKVNGELVDFSQQHSITLEAVVAASTEQKKPDASSQPAAPSSNEKTTVAITAPAEGVGTSGTASSSSGNKASEAASSGISQDTTVASTGSAARQANDVNSSAAVTTRSLPASESMVYTSTSGEVVSIPAAQLNENRAYRSLSAKTGKDFDKEYLDKMVDAHKEAVDTFKDAAKDADDADLRNFASTHIAALQEHLDKATSLKRSID